MTLPSKEACLSLLLLIDNLSFSLCHSFLFFRNKSSHDLILSYVAYVCVCSILIFFSFRNGNAAKYVSIQFSVPRKKVRKEMARNYEQGGNKLRENTIQSLLVIKILHTLIENKMLFHKKNLIESMMMVMFAYGTLFLFLFF